MLKDLPTEVIMNIQSFLLGEPDYLKFKNSNTLKKIQKKYLSRIYGKPYILQGSRELPEWTFYISPPRYITERTAITHYLKSQVKTIKSLLDNPYYFEDSGVKIEVAYNNLACIRIRRKNIKREDMIEKAMTSICNYYLKGSYNLDRRRSGRCLIQITVSVNLDGRDFNNITQKNHASH